MNLFYLSLFLMIFGVTALSMASSSDDRHSEQASQLGRPLSPTRLAKQLALLQARLDAQQNQLANQAARLAAQEEELGRQRQASSMPIPGRAPELPSAEDSESPSVGDKVRHEVGRVITDISREAERILPKVEKETHRVVRDVKKEFNRWKKKGFNL